ncbi:MAG: hypothetical protein JRJ64_06615 [Deltaproteobacteria bacterium]|nr:hypothetical protein [Deltaproteobacteria bacterium]
MSRIESTLDTLIALERPLLVALDVDGTVSPIVQDPDLAKIPASTLSTLAGLAEAPDVELALITGPGQTPSKRRLTSGQRGALGRFRQWIDEHARDAFIEYKPQAIAVHVRAIAARDPARADQLLREADDLAESLGLHVRRGKALREAEAEHHDKGSALREIFERSRARSVFFAGDDLTDFAAIDFAANHGVGAFVCSDEQRGTPNSSAVLLHSVDEVTALLAQLLQRITT